jgi:hypothetical protein
MKVPVLLLVFNRPDNTFRVFEEIKKQRPERLFIAADGPRKDKAGEAELCNQVRSIAALVDWPCDLKTLFRDQNIGCKTAVSSAINWFFDHVEEGIVFEDDCLPDASFFTFCEAMLDRYRDDERVMHISGNNFQFGIQRGDGSYYFSKYAHCWGWATWKRAWKKFDVNMEKYPVLKEMGYFDKLFTSEKEAAFWREKFDKVYSKEVDTVWDYQWSFAVWSNYGLSILPNCNLVTNIGFGADSTHTTSESNLAYVALQPMERIIHPTAMVPDITADTYTFKKIFETPFLYKVKIGVKGWLKQLGLVR